MTADKRRDYQQADLTNVVTGTTFVPAHCQVAEFLCVKEQNWFPDSGWSSHFANNNFKWLVCCWNIHWTLQIFQILPHINIKMKVYMAA